MADSSGTAKSQVVKASPHFGSAAKSALQHDAKTAVHGASSSQSQPLHSSTVEQPSSMLSCESLRLLIAFSSTSEHI